MEGAQGSGAAAREPERKDETVAHVLEPSVRVGDKGQATASSKTGTLLDCTKSYFGKHKLYFT